MKIDGRRSYKLARQGAAPAPEPRPVTVHEIDLVRYAWPEAEVEVRCAKGFYVRSLARALGEALGTGGHCASIRRTAGEAATTAGAMSRAARAARRAAVKPARSGREAARSAVRLVVSRE